MPRMSNSISTITVSLDVAKKLKEVGWPQEGCHFAYHEDDSSRIINVAQLPIQDGIRTKSGRPGDWASGGIHFKMFAAPTAEEILRRLPRSLPQNGVDRFLRCTYGVQMGDGIIWYEANDEMEFKSKHYQSADSLANAAAAMWCYLKEHNLLPAQ